MPTFLIQDLHLSEKYSDRYCLLVKFLDNLYGLTKAIIAWEI